MTVDYTLYLIKANNKRINITNMATNLQWSDNVETLGMQLIFEYARNTKDKFLANLDIVEIGDGLLLTNNENEIFRGIVTTEDVQTFSKTITSFDYAFYLNQSKTIKQFYKVRADEAIKKLCSLFNVQVGVISMIPVLISKIYKDKTIAGIIKDILDRATKETGVRYRLEMRAGKLNILDYADLEVYATFQPAKNLGAFDVTKAIRSINKNLSIVDMKNSIIVTSNNAEISAVLASEKDNINIEKFGLLQEVLSVDKKETSQAYNIARKQLAMLNRVVENTTIEMFGNDAVRAGRILHINESSFSLTDKYLVKSCTHTLKKQLHLMTLNVEKFEQLQEKNEARGFDIKPSKPSLDSKVPTNNDLESEGGGLNGRVWGSGIEII